MLDQSVDDQGTPDTDQNGAKTQAKVAFVPLDVSVTVFDEEFSG
jgi:hypothetical protein